MDQSMASLRHAPGRKHQHDALEYRNAHPDPSVIRPLLSNEDCQNFFNHPGPALVSIAPPSSQRPSSPKPKTTQELKKTDVEQPASQAPLHQEARHNWSCGGFGEQHHCSSSKERTTRSACSALRVLLRLLSCAADLFALVSGWSPAWLLTTGLLGQLLLLCLRCVGFQLCSSFLNSLADGIRKCKIIRKNREPSPSSHNELLLLLNNNEQTEEIPREEAILYPSHDTIPRMRHHKYQRQSKEAKPLAMPGPDYKQPEKRCLIRPGGEAEEIWLPVDPESPLQFNLELVDLALPVAFLYVLITMLPLVLLNQSRHTPTTRALNVSGIARVPLLLLAESTLLSDCYRIGRRAMAVAQKTTATATAASAVAVRRLATGCRYIAPLQQLSLSSDSATSSPHFGNSSQIKDAPEDNDHGFSPKQSWLLPKRCDDNALHPGQTGELDSQRRSRFSADIFPPFREQQPDPSVCTQGLQEPTETSSRPPSHESPHTLLPQPALCKNMTVVMAPASPEDRFHRSMTLTHMHHNQQRQLFGDADDDPLSISHRQLPFPAFFLSGGVSMGPQQPVTNLSSACRDLLHDGFKKFIIFVDALLSSYAWPHVSLLVLATLAVPYVRDIQGFLVISIACAYGACCVALKATLRSPRVLTVWNFHPVLLEFNVLLVQLSIASLFLFLTFQQFLFESIFIPESLFWKIRSNPPDLSKLQLGSLFLAVVLRVGMNAADQEAVSRLGISVFRWYQLVFAVLWPLGCKTAAISYMSYDPQASRYLRLNPILESIHEISYYNVQSWCRTWNASLFFYITAIAGIAHTIFMRNRKINTPREGVVESPWQGSSACSAQKPTEDAQTVPTVLGSGNFNTSIMTIPGESMPEAPIVSDDKATGLQQGDYLKAKKIDYNDWRVESVSKQDNRSQPHFGFNGEASPGIELVAPPTYPQSASEAIVGAAISERKQLTQPMRQTGARGAYQLPNPRRFSVPSSDAFTQPHVENQSSSSEDTTNAIRSKSFSQFKVRLLSAEPPAAAPLSTSDNTPFSAHQPTASPNANLMGRNSSQEAPTRWSKPTERISASRHPSLQLSQKSLSIAALPSTEQPTNFISLEEDNCPPSTSTRRPFRKPKAPQP